MPATARGPAGDASVGAQHAAPLPGDSGSRTAPRYAEVVLPVPVPRTYTYLIPVELEPRVVPGTRVIVPVRRRQVVGVVAAVDAPPPSAAAGVAARPILATPDAEPAITPPLLTLGVWISRYYGAPLGLALRALLPGALWSVRRPAGPAEQVERVLALTAALPSLLERERAFKRAPKRRVAYEALEAIGGSAPVRHLIARLGLSSAALDGLVTQGLARYTDVPRARDPFAGLSSPPPPDLTADQRRVVAGLLATPVETLHLAAVGKVVRFELPGRIGARPLPPVEVIDLRRAERVPDARGVPWTVALDEAVRGALGRGEQVILLLNRRGFATYLQCPACGDVPTCPRCAIALTVHQTPAALRCHYCGHEEPIPTGCRVCGKATQRMRGLGTQQLEHFVGLRFPEARIARMDLDTTSTKWAHHRVLDRMAQGKIDILLGTQMIAKGLDFPNVTVVGVVDADTGLHLPDFRAAERTFQLVAQVAGRAGRGPKGGRVYVQTRAPDHHAIRAAAVHSVAQFVAAELPLRAPPNPAYPPHVGLARFVASHEDAGRVQRAAERVAAWLVRANTERLSGALSVLGPAPCPIERLRGRWRWHLLVKAAG